MNFTSAFVNLFDGLYSRIKYMYMKFNSINSMISLAVLVVVGLIVLAVVQSRLPSKYDDFAQCLTDNGAKVYTATWCPVCERQLGLFGSASRKLNNKQCAVPGGESDLDLCAEDNIDSVPVWEKADGERIRGIQQLDQLAETFGCELPE